MPALPCVPGVQHDLRQVRRNGDPVKPAGNLEDLKRFDVPTLVLHGDDDQIVPYADSALISSKLIKNAKLVIYKGAPHGMCTTLKDRVNEELLAFLRE